jgi:hypothetical protein
MQPPVHTSLYYESRTCKATSILDTGLSISEQEAHRESASDGETIQIEHAAKLQATPFISLLVELHPKNVENDAQKKLGDLNIVAPQPSSFWSCNIFVCETFWIDKRFHFTYYS